MFTTNHEARATLFAGFDKFQASFLAFLAVYAKERDAAKRSAMATKFAKDIVLPYLDSAKDKLLEALVSPLLAVDAEIAKLLRVFEGVDA